jgi:hypothetical protein
VLAWPNDDEQRRLTARKCGWAARADPRALATASDEHGTFELAGLDASSTYSLFAAAEGRVCADPPEDVAVPAHAIELAMVPVFGARLRFDSGLEERPSRNVEGPSPSAFSVDPSAVMLPPDILPLLGLEPTELATFVPAEPAFLLRSANASPRAERRADPHHDAPPRVRADRGRVHGAAGGAHATRDPLHGQAAGAVVR